MPVRGFILTASLLGLCLLPLPRLRLAGQRRASLLARSARPVELPVRPCSPSLEARREGWADWMHAEQAVNRERETLEAWDPQAGGARGPEVWRLRLMSSDPGRLLRRARAAAQRAGELARTPNEASDAALLRARIECDLGNHEAELEEARRLVARRPRSPSSLGALYRAALYSGRAPLARATLVRLRDLPSPGAP